MDYRVDFAEADWEPALDGTARFKRVARGDRVFRLVELTPESRHPEWCKTGHLGMIVEGHMEIEFDGKTLAFGQGEALSIPSGAAHRHRPHAHSARVLMFLIEDEA